MKIFKSVLALSILLALLAACGDESSSSVSPEPRQCEDQNEDCDDTSSSSGEVSKNSSSSQKNSNKEKSSSSVEKSKSSSSSVIPASSGALQSSSSKDSTNSSSSEEKAKESSSSVKPSSSDAKSSSSEEVSSSSLKSSSSIKSSSSFVVDTARLCTPDYNLCNRPLSGDSIRSGAYKKFTDPRDGRSYFYLTINGKNKVGECASVTVMAENLNVGEMISGDKDQSNDSKIERYCYENDSANCEEYGGLYQWAEAMQLPSECNTKSCADLIKPNHQGICPNGWRLLTYDDYYIVVHADGNDDPLVEGVRAMGFGGHNYSGYSLIGAGYNWGYKFSRKDESTYWHYPEEGRSNDVNIASFVGYQTKSSTANSTQDTYKTNGFSVRCVMVE